MARLPLRLLVAAAACLALALMGARVSAQAAALVEVGLPDLYGTSLGSACRQNGFSGKCGPASSCGGGIVKGLCYGPAAIRCCMSASDARRAGLPKVAPARIIPAKMAPPQPAAARAAASVMQTKWKRFKTRNARRFASTSIEQRAFAVWQANRLRIIAANDRFRTMIHADSPPFMSDSPFADMDPVVFKKNYLSTRISRNRFGLLEIQDAATSDADSDSEADAEADADTDSELDSELDSETDAELDADLDAEIDAESDSETEVDAEHYNSFLQESMYSEMGLYEKCQDKATKENGECKLKVDCPGSFYRIVTGLCPGAANIACCIVSKSDAKPVGPVQPLAPSSSIYKEIGGELIVSWLSKQSPIKQQGQCGSCWAHASLTAVESVLAMKSSTNDVPVLSVQQVMDCSVPGGNGCGGGSTVTALDYMKTHGLTTAEKSPYLMKAGTCPEGADPFPSGPRIASWGSGTNAVNETLLLESLQKFGPQVIIVDASEWQTYSGGIFPKADCKNDWDSMNHGVVAVGYGQENGVNYWLLRNSWGKMWGESGYIRVEAGINSCGIALYPKYPVAA